MKYIIITLFILFIPYVQAEEIGSHGERLPDIAPIKTLRISIKEQYDKKGEEFDVGLKESLITFLTALDIKEISEGPADASLELEVTAVPLGAKYASAPAGAMFSTDEESAVFLWTAGEAKAKASILLPSGAVCTGSFEESTPILTTPAIPSVGKDYPYSVSLAPAWSMAKSVSCNAVAQSIAKISPVEIPRLIKALKDESREIFLPAAEGLKAAGSVATPYLIETLTPGEGQIREKSLAIRILSVLRDKSAVPALIRFINDNAQYAGTRSLAVEALGKIGGKEAFNELVRILELKDSFNADAAYALGEIGDKVAAPYLIKAMENDDKWIKNQCAIALGKLGAKEAVSALAKLLYENDYELRFNATKAIQKISGKDFDNEPYSCQQWWENSAKNEEWPE